MTLGGTQPMKSGKFFGLFSLHWNYCSQRGRQLIHLKFTFNRYHLCKSERRVAEKYEEY